MRTSERALQRIRAAGAGSSSCRGAVSGAMALAIRMAAVPLMLTLVPSWQGVIAAQRGVHRRLRTRITGRSARHAPSEGTSASYLLKCVQNCGHRCRLPTMLRQRVNAQPAFGTLGLALHVTSREKLKIAGGLRAPAMQRNKEK